MHQPDAVLSQPNPVSTTLYPVPGLTATGRVRIIVAAVKTTWAVTQPDPIELVFTVDGNVLTFIQSNPVSTQNYRPILGFRAENDGRFVASDSGGTDGAFAAFFLEGRSVSVEARITWAITQPTPLVCRVKWARKT